MTINEFAKLTNNEKATTIWNGTFLAHREKQSIKYALYAGEESFVEVSYNNTDNEILDFSPSQSRRLLEEYLSDIDLDALL